MAKKRKEKSEEEELDFKLPKFDEEKFLKKEKRNIKTLFISFILGLVVSLISFGFPGFKPFIDFITFQTFWWFVRTTSSCANF